MDDMTVEDCSPVTATEKDAGPSPSPGAYHPDGPLGALAPSGHRRRLVALGCADPPGPPRGLL